MWVVGVCKDLRLQVKKYEFLVNKTKCVPPPFQLFLFSVTDLKVSMISVCLPLRLISYKKTT